MLLPDEFATAMSSLPSPLKSPVATEYGLAPALLTWRCGGFAYGLVPKSDAAPGVAVTRRWVSCAWAQRVALYSSAAKRVSGRRMWRILPEVNYGISMRGIGLQCHPASQSRLAGGRVGRESVPVVCEMSRNCKISSANGGIRCRASSLLRCNTCGRECPTPANLQEWSASGSRSSAGRPDRFSLRD